ncbi:hypothetical protein JOM56_012076 [Amanita muscaria]
MSTADKLGETSRPRSHAVPEYGRQYGSRIRLSPVLYPYRKDILLDRQRVQLLRRRLGRAWGNKSFVWFMQCVVHCLDAAITGALATVGALQERRYRSGVTGMALPARRYRYKPAKSTPTFCNKTESYATLRPRNLQDESALRRTGILSTFKIAHFESCARRRTSMEESPH